MRYKEFVAVLMICCFIGCFNEENPVSDSTNPDPVILNPVDSTKQDSLIQNTVSDSINYAPVIQTITSVPDTVVAGESCLIKCTVIDSNNDELTFEWQTTGNIAGSGSSIFYTPNSCCGQPQIIITVTDGRGGSADTMYNIPFKYDDIE